MFLKMFSKALDKVEKALKTIVVMTLVVFTILVAIQVFSRYLFNSPITWSEQAARYLFVWMILLEMPILVRTKSNMAFTLLTNKLPKGVQTIIQIIITVLICVFAIFYLDASVQLCMRSVGKLAIGVGIPLNAVYLAQPVGALLLIIVVLEQLIYKMKDLFTHKKEVQS